MGMRAVMGNAHARSVVSSSMNMVITIFGFVLSAIFMFIICCRLLCFRLRRENGPETMQALRRSSPVDPVRQGLDPSIVKVFPTIKFNQQIFVSSEDNSCTICLGDYKAKEILRFLPRCGHAFHVACIDMWLGQHSTCPICRISLRTFPEWRHFSCPLISSTARPRFVPGALPDAMFERCPSPFHLASSKAALGFSKDSFSYGASAAKRLVSASGYLSASVSRTLEGSMVVPAESVAESSESRWQQCQREAQAAASEEEEEEEEEEDPPFQSSSSSKGPCIISLDCAFNEHSVHVALPKSCPGGGSDDLADECTMTSLGESCMNLGEP